MANWLISDRGDNLHPSVRKPQGHVPVNRFFVGLFNALPLACALWLAIAGVALLFAWWLV